MTIIEASIKINAPVEKAFAYITDINNMKNQYVTAVEGEMPLKLGSKYKITTTSMGRSNTITNEVVGFEKNKVFSVKTYGTPPAPDLVNTTLLEADGSGTKMTAQMDAVLLPAGMPSVPGMEDMMKKQMVAGIETSLAAFKKAIEG
jgi:uncharacterized protein YndB with AHSA1/START domain